MFGLCKKKLYRTEMRYGVFAMGGTLQEGLYVPDLQQSYTTYEEAEGIAKRWTSGMQKYKTICFVLPIFESVLVE